MAANERERSELAVGLTVLAALGLLFYSTVRVGGCTLLQADGPRLVARFDDAAGVAPRTDVLIAGVKVGEVDSVSLEDGRARIVVRVEDRDVGVPTDSTVAIRSRGLLGERVIEIVRGDSEQMLGDGDVLTQSLEAPDLDDLIADLSVVASDVREVTRSFRSVMGGTPGEEAVAQVVDDIRVVAGSLRSFVEGNQDRLARLVANFEQVGEHLSSFSEDVARLTDENDQTVSDLLTNFAHTAERMGEAMDDLAVMSARMEDGEGTLGKLMADEELYTKVDESVTELQRTLTEVRRAAEDAQEQLPVTVLGSLVGSLF